MNSIIVDSDDKYKLEIMSDSTPSFCNHYFRVCEENKESVGFYTDRKRLKGLADFIYTYLENN